MITDLNKIVKATEESAVGITNIEGQLGSIFSLFFRNSRADKEKELQKYIDLLNDRKGIDTDLDVIIDYHVAMQQALGSMKVSKHDLKLHSQRIEHMKSMIKNDNYAFSDETSEAEVEEEPIKEEPKSKKRGFLGLNK